MPVHFKTTSEYKSHYQPLQSTKSASFEPQPEQAAKPAGKDSTKLGISQEPQFQAKKRIVGPSTTLSTEFNQYASTPSDDFALLGKNDKFTENVRYVSKGKRMKPRGGSPPKQQKLNMQGKENLRAVPKTTPAPVVDTSKFRSKSAEDLPTPMAPRKEKFVSAGIRKEEKLSRDDKPVKASKAERLSLDVDANKMESIQKAGVKDKLVNNMNAFVQTNMEKGVADSAPEAPADYALRYKAGVAAPRPHRKNSEYSKAFTWKSPARSSPLLAAEQAVSTTDLKKNNIHNKVIYNNNPAVAPFKGDFPKASEYAAQFKQYKLVTPPVDREERAVPTVESQKQRSKVRRSKSMGALRPDKAPAAGSAPLVSPDNKRQTVESELQGTPLDERVPAATHGKMKRPRSEYASNFRSPTRYNVERGAWRGADPPQLAPARSGESDEGKPVLSNWFAEVIELRRKAQEYRRRAQGTHFSREHLVQLMAQQADMWDTVSTARSGTSTLSALSLESGMELQRKKQDDLESLREELRLNNLEEKACESEKLQSPSANQNKKSLEQRQNKKEKLDNMMEELKICIPTDNSEEKAIETKKLSPKATLNKKLPKDKQTKEEKLYKPKEEIIVCTDNSKEKANEIKMLSPKATQNKKSPKDKQSKEEKINKPKEELKICTNKSEEKAGETKKLSVKATSNKKSPEEIKEFIEKLNKPKEEIKICTDKSEEKASETKMLSPKVTQNQKSPKDQQIKQQRQKQSSGEDDISVMAHEGSDEEIGKPDLEPNFHEDVTEQRKRQKKRSQQKTAWEEDQMSELTPVSEDSGENKNGRIPTPKMKQMSKNSKRHHFDRTTPVVGGALLTSPPRAEKKTGKRTNISKSWCTPLDFEDSSTVVSSESFSRLAGQTQEENYTVQTGPISAFPTFGSPSKDTHMLRDDELSTDAPLATEFVDSPAKGTRSPAKKDDDRKQRPKSSKPRKFDLQSTIKEGFGQTYNRPVAWGIDGGMPIPRIDPDDDVLSVSARSVASSCSLASEVYERAQKRTEEFWGKKGIASR